MGRVVARAASLTAIILGLSIAAEVIFDLVVKTGLPGFFYAVLSAGMLGLVPAAPVLVNEDGTTPRLRAMFVLGLLALVVVNSLVVAALNGSDLGWSEGDYLLAVPAACYAITLAASYFAFRSRPRVS